jgi:uncharacterized protein
MGGLVKTMNNFFENLPDQLRKYKWLVLTFFVVMTAFLSVGINKIVIDESLDAYFQEGDPAKKIYDDFKVRFGGDESVYIVYKAKDGDIFSDRSLKALKGIHVDFAEYRLKLETGEVSPLDHIIDVKSLINVKYMTADDESLYSKNFIGDTLPENDVQREKLRQAAINHPDYPMLYLSENSEYGGIVIRTDFNAQILSQDNENSESYDMAMDDAAFEEDEFVEDPSGVDSFGTDSLNNNSGTTEIKKTKLTEYTPFLNAIRDIIGKPEYKDALEFHPVGNPVIMDFFGTKVMMDMGRITALVLVLIFIMLYILFRSFSAVVWPILIIILTLVWTMGLIGWSGTPATTMVSIIVFLVLAIGVADAVHILSGYQFFRNKGQIHKEALRSVMKKSGFACFLTSFTTCIGLTSLALVPLVPIANFGLFAAIGVLIAFIFTIFMLPLMLDLWSPVSKKKTEEKIHFLQKFLRKNENTGAKYPILILVIFAISGIIFFTGLMTLKVDSNMVEIIKEGIPLRQTYDLVNDYMGGTSNMEIMIDLKREDGLKDPDVLFKMEKLQEFLENNPHFKIIKTISVVNVVKDSYKALNNDDKKFYIIPSDPGVLSQTLFLFGNANPKDRRRLVSDDYSHGRVGIYSKNIGSIDSVELTGIVQDYVDKEFADLKEKYPDFKITLTGNMVLLSQMTDYISWAQIKSFSITLVVISIILLIVLGSLRAGFAAILPNVFPILATFGLMGFLKIPLDADTLLIAPVIIGLAVDDTIHFMTHFRQDVIKHGDIKKATVSSIREAGQAILFTSLILSVGFLVFILSFHSGLSHFGIFSAIAIMTAFLSDIYLLPALCVLLNIKFKSKTETALNIVGDHQ